MSKAKKFAKHKKSTKKSEDFAPVLPAGKGLAGKIGRHNMKKLDKFVSTYKSKINKSIDFQQTKVSIDSKDQQLAETANPTLIGYIKSLITPEVSKIPFAKGMLTISQKEPGLFNGFFQDSQGQIIEKFDNQTVELIAKNMEMKSLYAQPATQTTPSDPVAPSHSEVEAREDRAIARDEASKVVAQVLDELDRQKGKSLKIQFGDFSLELRKSVKGFVNDFRQASALDQGLIKKAIQSWRKKHKDVLDLPNDTAAAKELFNNWEDHSESFTQTVYGLKQLEQGNG